MSKLDPVKLNPAFGHHVSHGDGDHLKGHAVPNCLPRDGAPKRAHVVPAHGGMVSHTKSGDRALSGSHSSALDALSGQIVTGVPKSAPGWDSAARSGSPLAKAPAGKNLAPVKPSFGMRSRSSDHTQMHELGAAILDAAFSVGAPDDKAAHGRGPDGKKIK